MKNKGILFGIAAYGIWGLFPLYWKQLESIPALQIVAHRLTWSLVFLVIVLAVRRDWAWLKTAFNRRTLLIYLAAGCLLSINWLIYVYGVNAGFVVETSLGYFINPLVSVLLGVVFLRERLPISRWIPIGLAAVGVIYLTVNYGSLPWISLGLALSFGLYGLIKKLSPFGSLHGLFMETVVVLLPALGYLLFLEKQGTGAFLHAAPQVSVLLALAGVVTAIPLLMFASAARSIPLSTVGLLQYITPTCQFLLGVFVYGEPFTHVRLIGFSIIWLALLLFSLSGLYERRRAIAVRAANGAVPAE